MNRLTRRDFLQSSALTMAAFGSGMRSSNAADGSAFRARPHLKFPANSRERLAVASWPFRAYIDSPNNSDRNHSLPGMDLREFSLWVKKQFNVTGVEPLSQHFPALDPRYLDKFRESNEKAGMHVVNIPVDNETSYYDSDAATRRNTLENGKQWVDVAYRLGSPSIRTSIAPTGNAKPDVDVVATQLKQLADYAAVKNIVVNLENDNLISEDAFFIVKVIDKANHPYLHALPDFCNSMQTGNAKFNHDALTQLFPYAYNICHVKDSESNADGKVVHIDLKETFAILKASNYRGYLSMEWEGQDPPEDGTRRLIQASLENL